MDTSAHRLHRYGLLTIVTALLGTACAVLIIVWPAEVPESRWSYPFDTTSFTIAQLFFAVHHLGLFPALLAVLVLARRHGRATRAGLLIGILSMAALTVTEVIAIGAAEVAADSARANAMGAAYGVATMGLGLGFLMAGTGLARLPGATGRWVFLAIGVWIFCPMLPTLFMPLIYGRITIGIWLLMYAGIGLALLRLSRAAEGPGHSPAREASERPDLVAAEADTSGTGRQ
jgi:hypothetical protein